MLLLFGLLTARITLDLLLLEIYRNDITLLQKRYYTTIISDSDRYLLFIPPSLQSYDFAIMDLLTWRTQTVTLKFPETLDLYYAVMSPEEDRIVVPLYKFYKEESDFKFDSIVMINIKTNEQKILVSNWKSDEELYPIRWINTEQVLLSTTTPGFSYYQKSAEYWILNVNTGELVRTEKP